jgi:hypothetical protein
VGLTIPEESCPRPAALVKSEAERVKAEDERLVGQDLLPERIMTALHERHPRVSKPLPPTRLPTA